MPLYALFCKSQKIALHQGLIEQTKNSDPKFNKFISVDIKRIMHSRSNVPVYPQYVLYLILIECRIWRAIRCADDCT